MIKRVIVHDLSEEAFKKLGLPQEDTVVVAADGRYAPCQGCFGCWAKTPGKCVLKDKLQNYGALVANCEELIIITKNCYGGYSEAVKNVIDRGISLSLPFFEFRKGRVHHMHRYPKYQTSITAIFYGSMTDKEKALAEKLVEAHGINAAAKSTRVICIGELSDIKEEISCAL